MHKTLLLIASFFIAIPAAFATITGPSPDQNLNAFRLYANIGPFEIKVPTVVEIPLGDIVLERSDFVVINRDTQFLQPFFFRREVLANEIPIRTASDTSTASTKMFDSNSITYDTFLLPDIGRGTVDIPLLSAKPITSSSLTVLLDANVALPTSIAIKAVVGGDYQTVLAPTRMTGTRVVFPKTTSDNWLVTFTYAQPLRISELKLQQSNAQQSSVSTLRFLAQPGGAYLVYLDADRPVNRPITEAGDLGGATSVLNTGAITPIANPLYAPADTDGDGVTNVLDNCVSTANANQTDIDANGRGDACDDFDQDKIINALDNCPDNPNRDQRDTDGDSIGDVCDGEESRITEQYPWLPWVGIGLAALVLLTLLGAMLRPELFGLQQKTVPPVSPPPPPTPPLA